MPDFTTKPTLVGELVTLRPVAGTDAATLQALMADPEVTRLTGSAHTSSASVQDDYSLDQLIEIYTRWAGSSDRIVWVIVENATGLVVGESVLNDLDEGNLSCGFRIWISGATGRGLGTESVRLTVGHAFATGLHRVELEVYDFNPRARHVYETVGFIIEGTRREALLFDGDWVDCHQMGLLASEWRS